LELSSYIPLHRWRPWWAVLSCLPNLTRSFYDFELNVVARISLPLLLPSAGHRDLVTILLYNLRVTYLSHAKPVVSDLRGLILCTSIIR
jgi:hypothetical protein